MRALTLAFVGGIALASWTQAAPFALKPAVIELASAPRVQRVAQDCGWGWHRMRWRDQWGNWQSGDCVPNERGYGYDSRGAGWYNPYPD